MNIDHSKTLLSEPINITDNENIYLDKTDIEKLFNEMSDDLKIEIKSEIESKFDAVYDKLDFFNTYIDTNLNKTNKINSEIEILKNWVYETRIMIEDIEKKEKLKKNIDITDVIINVVKNNMVDFIKNIISEYFEGIWNSSPTTTKKKGWFCGSKKN